VTRLEPNQRAFWFTTTVSAVCDARTGSTPGCVACKRRDQHRGVPVFVHRFLV
jgi:hypothetical protein